MAKFTYPGMTAEQKKAYIAVRLKAAAPKTKIPDDPFLPNYLREQMLEQQKTELALREKEINEEATLADKFRVVGPPPSEANPDAPGIVFEKGKEVEVPRSHPFYEKCVVHVHSGTLKASGKEIEDDLKLVRERAAKLERQRGARRMGLAV